jgi:hypothetical protein
MEVSKALASVSRKYFFLKDYFVAKKCNLGWLIFRSNRKHKVHMKRK